jgi:two-component system, sensor histidine kinase and response regulator
MHVGPTRILLIDDDAIDRQMVRRALKASTLQHTLVEAPDGASGLAAAQRETFDCVLLDYRLPDVDTYELLGILISSEGGHQPVVILTGETDQDVPLRLMRAGALDYLAKDEASPANLSRAIRYAKARRAFVTELEDKSRKLDNLNRLKTLLFSIIAHDLRNPFQLILGLSKSLSKGVANKDPASVERRAQGVVEAATRAHALMESLFSWANVQITSQDVTLTPVRLDMVADEILREFAERANDKRLSLTSQCNDVWVLAHRDMLLVILRNLVGNALKFTLPGGSVDIAASSGENVIEISVSDTGLGMTSDQLADLFKLDRRSSTIGTGGEAGSGLGLLLCRDLVELQSGHVSVTSQAGKGTTFQFTLAPAVPQAAPNPQGHAPNVVAPVMAPQ